MFFQTHPAVVDAKADLAAPAVNPDNATVVLVWHPKLNGKDATALQVLAELRKVKAANAKDGGTRRADIDIGHVAMQTPNRYVSIWPAESAGGQRFKVVEAAYSTLDVDVESEGRAPDLIVYLYSLNTPKMEALFEKVKSDGKGFRLGGDTSLAGSHDWVWSSEKSGDSCCGLVFHLLQAGGIEAITPLGKGSTFSIYISPDSFATYIQAVKAKELTQHPTTKAFEEIEGAYRPEPPKRLSKFM